MLRGAAAAAAGGGAAVGPKFTDEMSALVAKAKVDDDVQRLLLDKEIFEPLDFSLIAENEKACVDAIASA